MLKKIVATVALLLGVLATSCQSDVAPAEQVQQQVQQQVEQNAVVADQPAQTVVQRSVASARKWEEYACAKNKTVKVQKRNSKQKGKKVIAVNFNDTQHLLSAVLTKDGEKYSNIRWIWWHKRSGVASLTDNSGKVLAGNCKKAGVK